MAGFKSLLSTEEYDFRFACGITKTIGRMELLDKKKTIDAMCLHYVILVSLAELEQLRRGLAIQKFNSLMLSEKQLGKPLHHQSKKYQVISSRICTLLYFHLLEATKGHRREHHDVMGVIPAVCGR